MLLYHSLHIPYSINHEVFRASVFGAHFVDIFSFFSSFVRSFLMMPPLVWLINFFCSVSRSLLANGKYMMNQRYKWQNWENWTNYTRLFGRLKFFLFLLHLPFISPILTVCCVFLLTFKICTHEEIKLGMNKKRLSLDTNDVETINNNNNKLLQTKICLNKFRQHRDLEFGLVNGWWCFGCVPNTLMQTRRQFT